MSEAGRESKAHPLTPMSTRIFYGMKKNKAKLNGHLHLLPGIETPIDCGKTHIFE